MAFADEIIHKSDKSVILVDIRKAPGGHLLNRGLGRRRGIEDTENNRGAPLSRPATACSVPPTPCFVNSRPLKDFAPDKDVLTREEMLDYYQAVLQDLVSTGRARFFPECMYSNCSIRSTLGKVWKVKAKKVVEANYGEASSGQQHRLPAAPGISVCKPDDPKVLAGAPEYLVVGAGRAGMEAVFWLIKNEIDPDLITWVLPNDSAFWLRDCGCQRPWSAAPSLSSRTAPSPTPRATGEIPAEFQCPSLSSAEIEKLRLVSNTVRLGRVLGVESSRLLLERGQVPLRTGAMVLDCSEGLEPAAKALPIWQPGRLVLQPLATCPRAKSAALIAAIELQPGTDEEKNLFKPAAAAPLPNVTAHGETPRLQLFKATAAPPPPRGALHMPPRAPPLPAKALAALDVRPLRQQLQLPTRV
eukprot:TRINITY_DN50784_c0_g1_i1.p1 TRINITY_DN50784_c0_g1~~TRINITY_DN50784_c0_g1_i1.p1  ORF type:complete len:466 (+),score=97.85 TRINITY_DN50784_c0_g1_i1:156-1400(+)